MKNFLIVVFMIAFMLTTANAVERTITKIGTSQAAQYNLDVEQNTAVNASVTGYDLLRTAVMYHGGGPAEKLTALGVVVESGLVAAGTSAWTLVTHEIIDNGVTAWVYKTAEILAWQTADTLEAGERCYYTALYPSGTTETDALCLTILQGTEYDATTETALLPTIPSGYIAVCSVLVISTDTAFVPSTTNWNATGCTSTIVTHRGPMFSGASAPADTGLSDIDMTVDWN